MRGRIGFRGYTQADLVEEGNGAITFSPADIDETGNVSQTDNKYISWMKYEESPEIKVQPGDILFTKTASIGKVGFVRELKEKATINPQFALLTPLKGTDGSFTFLAIRTDAFMKQVRDITGGSSVPTMSQEKLKELTFMSPSLEEQNELGAIFENLDNLITFHRRKHERLKNIKKSMLEKMFPCDGSNVPEIRFAGFTNPWEQRKLKDVASSFEYGLNAAAKEFDGTNKYLRITDIDDSSRAFKEDDLTSPDTNLSIAGNYQLNEGDVLFARTGASVGKSFIYRGTDGLVYFAGFLIRARIKPEYCAEFIFQNTLTSQYEKYIQITSQRSGQPGVNAQEYGEYSFLMPEYSEQKKIGDFLRQIDDLITLHQRKYEMLQKLKNSLLQKMLV